MGSATILYLPGYPSHIAVILWGKGGWWSLPGACGILWVRGEWWGLCSPNLANYSINDAIKLGSPNEKIMQI